MRLSIKVVPAMVKAEAQRRIEMAYPLWRQVNILREGGAALDQMGGAIDAIRAASEVIEQRKPIPPDFAADRHWN